MNAGRRYHAIVIGGSSGSIDALLQILPGLPATLRASVIVVLHLPRERPSLLGTVLQPHCALPIREAQDREPVEPATVYTAPPDYHLLVDAGPVLSLSVDPPVHYSRPSIDVLFESAADAFGPRLVGILLSGANQDGARGLEAVRSRQGLAIVQHPASAAMPAMPESALARLTPDHLLPPGGIASLLTAMHLGEEL